MRDGRRWIAWMTAALGLLVGSAPRADDTRPSAQIARPSAQVARPNVPAGLPCYDIDMHLDPVARRVSAREHVVFTNRSTGWTRELVFHVYPRYQMPEGDRLILSKTLEILRLSPDEAM